MLTELRVRDLAVIADVVLKLEPGLNVLTGETGAGKSMLVDALALLLGERASMDIIRPGAARTVVEAVFDVAARPVGPDAGETAGPLAPPAGAGAPGRPDSMPPGPPEHLASLLSESGVELEDDRLIVRRDINAEGRNRAWANGSPTTVSVLATLGRACVDLHGQHEAQSLLKPQEQRDILDAFGDAAEERDAVRCGYEEVSRLLAEELRLVAQRDDVRRRADYLHHVAREIEAAAPRVGEDEQLALEASRLGNVEELTRLAGRLAGLLDGEDGAALDLLGQASRVVEQLERLDAGTGEWRQLLDDAFATTDEVARRVRAYASEIESDPGRLEAVERRRDALFRLTQKYGPTLEDVLRQAEDARRELALLDTADDDAERLRQRREAAEGQLIAGAAGLSAKRQKAAAKLAKAVDALLPGLGLADGKFQVVLTPLASIGPHGGDDVTFVVRLNVGMDARPLAQVASGGELSRLMLALKVVLAHHDAVPTLVFDEVDQGIGGEVAVQVAEALHEVAASRQVLVITHLAQIAARADHHLVVAKRPRGGIATADVAVISGAARVTEIARMLGDGDDPVARKHAERMLKKTLGGLDATR